MDYKQKYLKYKFKYLQAQKIYNEIKKRQTRNMKGGENQKQKCLLDKDRLKALIIDAIQATSNTKEKKKEVEELKKKQHN